MYDENWQPIKLIFDYKFSNWNEIINANRMNRFVGASLKKKEMEIAQKFLIDKPRVLHYPIKINCIWHIKNINSDLDNKCIKPILDVMQEMGILENDNIKHIREINHKAVKSDRDYLEMEIIEDEVC